MKHLSEARIRYFWRTKYPWVFIFYILAFGILAGVLKAGLAVNRYSAQFAVDVFMIAVFTGFVFLYVFYIFGVRPVELEHQFK
jgi:hypothetical protein